MYLADIPHRVLTRPARVFDYSFEGMQKARGRENILRLEARSLWPRPLTRDPVFVSRQPCDRHSTALDAAAGFPL